MPRLLSPAQKLASQALELSIAAPQVMAHRLSRIATAGVIPNDRDRKEFLLMGNEKILAFYQSWAAMWVQGFKVQMEFNQSMLNMFLAPAMGKAPNPAQWLEVLPSAGAKVLAAGLSPVHGKAVSNARRLGRAGSVN